jgi:hypothetical protein
MPQLILTNRDLSSADACEGTRLIVLGYLSSALNSLLNLALISPPSSSTSTPALNDLIRASILYPAEFATTEDRKPWFKRGYLR